MPSKAPVVAVEVSSARHERSRQARGSPGGRVHWRTPKVASMTGMQTRIPPAGWNNASRYRSCRQERQVTVDLAGCVPVVARGCRDHDEIAEQKPAKRAAGAWRGGNASPVEIVVSGSTAMTRGLETQGNGTPRAAAHIRQMEATIWCARKQPSLAGWRVMTIEWAWNSGWGRLRGIDDGANITPGSHDLIQRSRGWPGRRRYRALGMPIAAGSIPPRIAATLTAPIAFQSRLGWRPSVAVVWCKAGGDHDRRALWNIRSG